MKMKFIIVLAVLLFSFGVVGISFAVEVQGKIVKIQGAHSFFVKDKSGKQVFCEVELEAGIKIGDMVTVKDGKVTKDTVQDSAPKAPTPEASAKKKSSKGK